MELILAFGNYMNSQKKGPCYGFKLQSLDSLTITKSTDKKQHIVHYLASVVEQKYPDLKSFYTELSFLEKASQFSLENIMTDVVELERGMELTKRELENRLKAPNAQGGCRFSAVVIFQYSARSTIVHSLSDTVGNTTLGQMHNCPSIRQMLYTSNS